MQIKGRKPCNTGMDEIKIVNIRIVKRNSERKTEHIMLNYFNSLKLYKEQERYTALVCIHVNDKTCFRKG